MQASGCRNRRLLHVRFTPDIGHTDTLRSLSPRPVQGGFAFTRQGTQVHQPLVSDNQQATFNFICAPPCPYQKGHPGGREVQTGS